MEKKRQSTIVSLIILILSCVVIGFILITPSFFEFFWNDLLRNVFTGFTYFFRFVTEFGGTLIYLAVIFTIYWGINKKLARNLLLVYVASNFVNFYAKSMIGRERPPESSWYLISASHLSTPSGHAQSSAVFWGFIAIKSKRIIMWILCVIIIILVGLSRIYLGVHWLGDVLAGWFFGIIILDLTLILEEPIKKIIGKYNSTIVYLILILIGGLIMVFTEVFLQIEYDLGGPGGQLIGLSLGFVLEEKYVNFDENNNFDKVWKVILRILIGILLIAIIYLIIYLVIDSDVYWMNAVHYIITLLVGIVVWPLIFKKINL